MKIYHDLVETKVVVDYTAGKILFDTVEQPVELGLRFPMNYRFNVGNSKLGIRVNEKYLHVEEVAEVGGHEIKKYLHIDW